MGQNGSRIIHISNIEDRLNDCKLIRKQQCPIYGYVNFIQYGGMEFFIGESQSQANPHPMSIHYLVKPKLLIYPEFTLLEEINPQSVKDVFNMIIGISQMAIEGGDIGIGRRRLAFRDRWGVVGEKQVNWPYRQILQTGDISNIYFSPQMMINLSQHRTNPKYNIQKADVFALGILIVQKIFQQDLDLIFDYDNYEIRLNPLLQKLQQIKEQYGQQVSGMFVSMLEIEEQDRIDFSNLKIVAQNLLNQQNQMEMRSLGSSSNSQNNRNKRGYMEHSKGNKTPTRNQPVSINHEQYRAKFRNDVSPLRGRFGSNVRVPDRIGKTPERLKDHKQMNKSPLRRDLRIHTRFDKENSFTNRNGTPKAQNKLQGRTNYSPINRH